MSRNSLFFRKRPKSLIQTWLGKRKMAKPGQKVTNALFRHKTVKLDKE